MCTNKEGELIINGVRSKCYFLNGRKEGVKMEVSSRFLKRLSNYIEFYQNISYTQIQAYG